MRPWMNIFYLLHVDITYNHDTAQKPPVTPTFEVGSREKYTFVALQTFATFWLTTKACQNSVTSMVCLSQDCSFDNNL